jgi:hypothetical protein
MTKRDDTWQLLGQRKTSHRQLLVMTRELGLNKAAAGRFIGVSERTTRRMFRGQAEIPVSVGLLLRLMLKHGEQPIVPAWSREQN